MHPGKYGRHPKTTQSIGLSLPLLIISPLSSFRLLLTIATERVEGAFPHAAGARKKYAKCAHKGLILLAPFVGMTRCQVLKNDPSCSLPSDRKRSETKLKITELLEWPHERWMKKYINWYHWWYDCCTDWHVRENYSIVVPSYHSLYLYTQHIYIYIKS